MVERRLEAARDKAAAHIADSVAMTAEGLGHRVIGVRVSLVAIQQQQDPSPRVCPGGSTARADQRVQGCTLVVTEMNREMFAHGPSIAEQRQKYKK